VGDDTLDLYSRVAAHRRRRPDCPAPWRALGADRHAPHPDAPIHAIAEKLIIGAEDLPAAIR
jgi:hypothetical protein